MALINAEQYPYQPNPFQSTMILAAPITHGNNLLGLMVLDGSANLENETAQPELKQQHEFTIWDMAVAEGIAQLAGLAIEQARWQQEALTARTSEAAMREANALKDEFLAITAHEFRTPLTVILAHSQLALRALQRTSEQEQHNYLRENFTIIEEQTRQLTNIVNSFLEVTQINRGQLALKSEEVDLAEIATHVVSQHAATSPDHSIRCIIEPSEQAYLVKGDSARLRQIIANLVQNAKKYSPQGGPVTLSLRRFNSTIEVCVEDKGIGVPQDAQAHLFERFYRGPNAEESKTRGIGLGLYLVAQLVQMHGGTIRVESDGIYGEGSRFIFTLPALVERTLSVES
jgi:signal transduction histidine kinase